MKINIIGAGISGIYAGYLLSKSNIEFEIFEASERSGGRIYSWPIKNSNFVELGAEVVYAPKAPLVRALNKLGDPIYSLCGENYYSYQQQLLTHNNLSGFPLIEKLMKAFDNLEDYNDKEMSLLQYFQNQEYYTSDMASIVEAFACEYGTTANNLGIKNLAFEENLWSGGDEEYYSHLPLQRVSDYYKNKIKDSIRYNKIITKVSHSKENIVVTDQHGKEHVSDKAIISVNLGVLKAGDIQFDPVLPPKKQLAIDSIGIEAGMKVILLFSERWWPENLLTLEGGELCSEFLATRNYRLPALTGFVMGNKVNFFKEMSDQKIGALLTKELDIIFRNKKASQSLTRIFLKNWGNDIFHKGAYSFPTTTSNGMREVLAEPIDDKLFFMGEACNVNGHAASIHGAMETAETICKKLTL